MAVVNDCQESFAMADECSVKNNHESNDSSVLPGGEPMNSHVLKSSGNENVDTEPCERKKKTRRGKPKRKNPYNKEGNESRKAVNRTKNRPRFACRHADAPYNTNEFLMEDHNTFVKLNSPPTANIGHQRSPRVRDPSFTSVDSDEDHFYSSPEDEEEFLTKEFSNTYQDLHVETLQSMSKPELIQQVLQLEEKLDILEKRLGTGSRLKNEKDDKIKSMSENLTEDGISGEEIVSNLPIDKIKQFQLEIGRLRLENEKLQIENERLRRRNRSSSVSSVDSESDSTTSSPSSVSDLSDKEELIQCNENEDMDDSREKSSAIEESNNADIVMEDKDTK
ncbi:protein HEXIM1 [Macrosteles quadrilineatus]|uniref:protein HEXIM1 n=1 Tax=Macrosteles quadrilineatus TaxID=74068 RepID=UPI0023E2681A|nr:protein HEXIM1 [Macrosteles quadrilineatus]